MKTFGDRIKIIRLKNELTQEEFGKLFHVTKVAVSNWENQNRFPDEEILKSIALHFDVSLDYLIGISDNPNPLKEDPKQKFIRRNAEDIYKVDPDMLITMCRATSDLPEEDLKKIKEYSAMLIEKHLRERAEREKNRDK